MKLKHNFKKPIRFFKQYQEITISNNCDYWWSENYNKWMLIDDITCDFSNCCNCNSIRSFRRHLRKHTELPKGTILILGGKYVGQIVYGKIK